MSRHRWLIITFFIIMFDSLINYFLHTFYHRLPTNALVPITLLLAVQRNGISYLMPSRQYLLALLLGIAGYSLAIVTADLETPYRLVEIGGAVVAFITGYALFKHIDDERLIAKMFMSVSIIYSITCLIALHRWLPNQFPLVSAIWSLNGVLVERPRVTIDQNFQTFYLLAIAPLLALPVRPVFRFVLILIGAVLAFDVIAQLQSRSGTLVFLGVCAMALLLPLRIRQLGRGKVIMVPITLFIGGLLALPVVIKQGAILWARFFETDYATGEGRLQSFLYLFEKLINPVWWFLPQGNAEFLQKTGNLAHSNITASFLEGGIMGLISWCMLVPLPLYHLFRYMLRKRIDVTGCLVLLMGLGMFVMQMSLNAPFVDQVWLWSGATAGTLVRLRRRHLIAAKTKMAYANTQVGTAP